MCGLCGFLYKEQGRYGPVGRAMFDMLTPLDRRGTDSTGVALYGHPRPRLVRGCGCEWTQTVTRPRRVFDALAEMGSVSEQTHTGRNLRARIGYGGDLGDLADGSSACRIPRCSRSGARWRSSRTSATVRRRGEAGPYSEFDGSHAIGHTRMATESLVDVAHSHPSGRARSPTSPSCTTATSPTTTGSGAGSEGKGHRFATGNDSEAIAVYIADAARGRRVARGRAALLGPRARRHLRLPDLHAAGHRRRPRPVRTQAADLCRGRRDRVDRERGDRASPRLRLDPTWCHAS